MKADIRAVLDEAIAKEAQRAAREKKIQERKRKAKLRLLALINRRLMQKPDDDNTVN